MNHNATTPHLSAPADPRMSGDAMFPPPAPGSSSMPPYRRRGTQDLTSPTKTSLELVARSGSSAVNRTERRAGQSRPAQRCSRSCRLPGTGGKGAPTRLLRSPRIGSVPASRTTSPDLAWSRSRRRLCAGDAHGLRLRLLPRRRCLGSARHVGGEDDGDRAVCGRVSSVDGALGRQGVPPFGAVPRSASRPFRPREEPSAHRDRYLHCVVVLAVIRFQYTGSLLSAALFGLVGVGTFLGLRYASRSHFRPENKRARQHVGRRRWWTTRLLSVGRSTDSAGDGSVERRPSAVHHHLPVGHRRPVGPGPGADGQRRSDERRCRPSHRRTDLAGRGVGDRVRQRPPRLRGNAITGERY